MSSSQPTSSDTKAASNSSSSPNRYDSQLRRCPEETVHMNILGRDVSDNEQQSTSKTGISKTSGSKSTGDSPARRNRRRLAASAEMDHSCPEVTQALAHPANSSSTVYPDRTYDQTAAASLSNHQSPSGVVENAITKHNESKPFSAVPTTKTKVPKRWFDRITWGTTESDYVHTTDYQCLEAPSPPEASSKPKIADHKSTTDRKVSPANDVASSKENSSISSSATVEDQLKQECSFFYQEINNQRGSFDVLGDGVGNRKMKVVAPTHRPIPTSSLAAMSRRRVMSSRDGAIFMSKYEQLNQDMNVGDSDEEDMDEEYQNNNSNLPRDLFLDEEVEFGSASYHQHNPGPNDNVVTDGLRTSSLFYEQDGRVLMRLPRDHVRLIVDHDLQPGILSVEQWRKREDVEQEVQEAQRQWKAMVDRKAIDPLTTKGGGQHPATKDTRRAAPSPGLTNLPELRYVLTVPDDLYQRVVSEMSMEAFPPYWGFFKCCNNHESTNDRADIKLALVILAIVLLLLMLGSIEWPTD